MSRILLASIICIIALAIYGVVYDILPTARFKGECKKIEGAVAIKTMDGKMLCLKSDAVIFADKL